MYVLSTKLKMFKEKLKFWTKTSFGNVFDNVKMENVNLDSIQLQISDHGPSETLLNSERKAKIVLEKALSMEEIFLARKARIKWHREGDRNTAFFHKSTTMKQTYRKMASLRVDGITETDPDIISTYVTNYYNSLFTKSPLTNDNRLIDEVIPQLIINNMNNMPTLTHLHKKIKVVVFNLNKDSSSGPGGFGGLFFQE